jgi:hypothetical protein
VCEKTQTSTKKKTTMLPRPALLATAALLAGAAAASSVAAAASAPSRGTILALLADPADRHGRFGPFFDGLASSGWALDVRPASSKKSGADAESPPVKLKEWDAWAYEGVVVLPGSTNGVLCMGNGCVARAEKARGIAFEKNDRCLRAQIVRPPCRARPKLPAPARPLTVLPERSGYG